MKKTLFIPLAVLVIVALACSVSPKDTPVVVLATDTPSGGGATMPPAPTMPAAPTMPPAPTMDMPTSPPPGGYFVEEFDGDLSNWNYWVTAGDSSYQYAEIAFGRLRWDMPSPETYAYVENPDSMLDDVYVEARYETVQSGQNGVAVICRSSDRGWYEFRVFNRGFTAGRYSIFRYDYLLKAQNKNPYVNLLNGYENLASVNIINGNGSTNTIGINCEGNQLTFYINGVLQQGLDKRPLIIVDDTLSTGAAGLGVMSYSDGSVQVEFDYLSASRP